MLRYQVAWVPMVCIAVANGALRQVTFDKVMPEFRAHQLSTLTGSVLIGGYVWYVINRWPPGSGHEAVNIGLVWLAMTVAFEFFMGLVLMRRSLASALADYNLLAGRVWVLFLVWLAAAPWLFYRLR